MKPRKSILAGPVAELQGLCNKLSKGSLLAQGSVFEFEPPPEAPRARTRYIWTRKVNNKTVTKALSKEQFDILKAAIEANRKLEHTLQRIRKISQDAILKTSSNHRKKRGSKPS